MFYGFGFKLILILDAHIKTVNIKVKSRQFTNSQSISVALCFGLSGSF